MFIDVLGYEIKNEIMYNTVLILPKQDITRARHKHTTNEQKLITNYRGLKYSIRLSIINHIQS